VGTSITFTVALRTLAAYATFVAVQDGVVPTYVPDLNHTSLGFVTECERLTNLGDRLRLSTVRSMLTWDAVRIHAAVSTQAFCLAALRPLTVFSSERSVRHTVA